MITTPGELAQITIQIGTVAMLVKVLADGRKARNGNGSAKLCALHDGLEKTIQGNKDDLKKELESFHKENREDHLQMNQKMDTVSTAVNTACATAQTAAAAASAAIIAANKKEG